MADLSLDYSTQIFLNALRNSSELSKIILTHKTSLEVALDVYENNINATVQTFTRPKGLYSIVSNIWRSIFPDPHHEFNDYHELALRDYILVEQFGWAIDNWTYWRLDKKSQTRKGPKTFQPEYAVLGFKISKAIRKFRWDYMNKKQTNKQVINFLLSS